MISKRKIIKLAVLLALVPLIGLGCKSSTQIDPQSVAPVELQFWRVFDEPDDFRGIIQNFQALYPHISVKVTKVRFEDYEQELLRAIAEGRGPDIVSVHNTWLSSYQKILAPRPDKISLPAVVTQGRKTITILRETPPFSLRDVRNNYADAVYPDVVINDEIYGLPFSLDTLVLYYNKTLLNLANIPTPPATWTEFKEQVKALTAQDGNGELVQAGAALGSARNINRAPDILAVLMMQNGTEMTDERGTRALFDSVPAGLAEKDIVPGQDALRFYADFSSPAKEVYTWNEKMPESLQAFASQKAAFFFGYAYHLPLIRSQGPSLNLGIAKLPQIGGGSEPVNFANYWVEAVTRASAHPAEAWAFLQFAAAPENVVSYLESAKKPTALRALIAGQREDDTLVNFVDQILTARSWYRGLNPDAAEEALRAMIEQVVKGELPPEEAISLAARKVTESLR